MCLAKSGRNKQSLEWGDYETDTTKCLNFTFARQNYADGERHTVFFNTLLQIPSLCVWQPHIVSDLLFLIEVIQ